MESELTPAMIVKPKIESQKYSGLPNAIASFASAAAGNESRVASLSSIAKSISSLISLIKNGKN